jgi:hypothetical protein
MKIFRWLLIVLGVFLLIAGSGWIYTSSQLALARSKGVYASAEQGMQSMVGESYEDITSMNILYAGPDSSDGSFPHIWYGVAKVCASSRMDGVELDDQGCDSPGSFFLHTREGWVHVPEGAFPEIIGFWMSVFGMAGPG